MLDPIEEVFEREPRIGDSIYANSFRNCLQAVINLRTQVSSIPTGSSVECIYPWELVDLERKVDQLYSIFEKCLQTQRNLDARRHTLPE